MKLSYVLISRNRRERLLKTLRLLETTTPLSEGTWETFVVDNASEDGTASAIRRDFPDVRVIELPENEGMPARNHAIAKASGKYIAFLDDDSYPVGDTIPAALRYLSRHAKTAALVGRVILPDGGLEAPAFPRVTLGGASIVRKSAIEQIGGFAPEFFRQAEEYDFSFRLWQAGFKVERFEDLTFRHDKEPGGRVSSEIHRLDLRNNLIVVERYLPRPLRRAYRADWVRRYGRIAIDQGHGEAVNRALCEARVWAKREASIGRRTLNDAAIESLFDLNGQAAAVKKWAKANDVRRVVVADYSKNLYATFRACRLAELDVVAVAEGRRAFAGRRYRGVPMISEENAAALKPDGVVLSSVNPAQVESRLAQLRAAFNCPVLGLWEPQYLGQAPGDRRPKAVAA